MDMAEKSEDIVEIAFDWIARSSADDFPVRDLERMNAWLDEDIEHRTAFELAQLTWTKVEEAPRSAFETSWFRPPGTTDTPGVALTQRIFDRLFRPRGLVAAGVAAAATALIVIQSGTKVVPAPDLYTTGTGETSEIALEDGSSVVLGADSMISASYSADLREISLARGEAFFTVTPDKSRPFIVSGGLADIVVVGTSFEVSRNSFSTSISVKEGTVSVSPRTGAGVADRSEDLILTSGQRIDATSEGISAVTNIDIESVGSWRDGQLIYVSAPLAEILSDADRYYAGRIEILDPELQALSLSLIHEAGDTQALLELLGQALPIRTTRLSDGTIVVTGDLQTSQAAQVSTSSR